MCFFKVKIKLRFPSPTCDGFCKINLGDSLQPSSINHVSPEAVKEKYNILKNCPIEIISKKNNLVLISFISNDIQCVPQKKWYCFKISFFVGHPVVVIVCVQCIHCLLLEKLITQVLKVEFN